MKSLHHWLIKWLQESNSRWGKIEVLSSILIGYSGCERKKSGYGTNYSFLEAALMDEFFFIERDQEMKRSSKI
jgi:hypothetical protein